jgi:hypothetical protein
MSNNSDTDSYNERQATITIRRATVGDDAELDRLSQLEGLPVPAEPVLVAEVDGRLRAAIALYGSEAIADPFERTDHLLRMLREHAAGPPAAPRAWRSPVGAPRHRRAPWPA